MRRAGAVVLAVILLGNLAAITYWRFDELGSAARAGVLAALWVIGIVALVLLVRAARAR
jgi:hypothetical protein